MIRDCFTAHSPHAYYMFSQCLGGKPDSQVGPTGNCSQTCQSSHDHQPTVDLGLYPDIFFIVLILWTLLFGLWAYILGVWNLLKIAMGAKTTKDSVTTETTMVGLLNLTWQGSLKVPSVLITVCLGLGLLIVVEGCCGGCTRMIQFCCWQRSNQRARLAECQPPSQQQPYVTNQYRPRCHVDYPMMEQDRRSPYDTPPNYELKQIACQLNAIDNSKLFIV